MSDFERVQREVEAGEQWLRGRLATDVPTGLAERTKAAIRAELGADRTRRWAWRLNRWQGGVAAAAMIALSVVLVRSWNVHERVRTERRAAVDQFVATLSVVESPDASLAVLGEEIDAVSQAGRSSFDTAIDTLSESIETATVDERSTL